MITIERIELFRAYCDKCGRPLHFTADRMQMESVARESGWHVDGWRAVCPQCHREVG